MNATNKVFFPLIRKEYDLDNYYQRQDLVGSISGGYWSKSSYEVTEFVSGVLHGVIVAEFRKLDERKSKVKALRDAEKAVNEALAAWRTARDELREPTNGR